MFGCNGSCYAFVLVNSSKIVIKNCHQKLSSILLSSILLSTSAAALMPAAL
jgi:hypothetical protein